MFSLQPSRRDCRRRSAGRPRAGAAFAAAAGGALLLSGLCATAASAGCGGDVSARPAAYRAGEGDAALVRTAFNGYAPIVGMWSVTFVDSAGKLNDFGYQQWHADGTEILNSGSHSPATQNFCLGVWKENGRGHYLLNHWALSYDPSTITAGPTSPTLKINIREDVEVGPGGDVYKGAFSQDVFNASTGAPLAHITGNVTGQRIKPNA